MHIRTRHIIGESYFNDITIFLNIHSYSLPILASCSYVRYQIINYVGSSLEASAHFLRLFLLVIYQPIAYSCIIIKCFVLNHLQIFESVKNEKTRGFRESSEPVDLSCIWSWD